MRDILLAVHPDKPSPHAESRAFQLAEAGGGRVHALMVEEEAGAVLPAAERFGDDLAARRGAGTLGRVAVQQGEAWERILSVAADRECGLIVIGASSDRTDVRRALFGRTAERLAHRAAQPILSVRRPAERPYGRLVVGTDCSEGSRHAALAAAALLPEAPITLLHAYRFPFEGFLGGEANEQELRDTSRHDLDAFVAEEAWPADVAARMTPALVQGDPTDAILDLDRENPIDLVVLGAHGRTGPLEKLLGGTAERLLKTLPMDVMLVRQPDTE